MTSLIRKGLGIAAAISLALATPALAATASPTAVSAAVEQTVTLVNQDSAGNSTVRFDVDGNAIDAHDGQIQRFGDLYYLYGTAYGCGYEWNTPGAPFCGFVSYSSPDLVNWTPEGPLFDASTSTWQDRCDGSTYGCYRPHVVFNPSTGQYVLWINTYDVGVGYRVFTSADPAGAFTEVAVPDLGSPEGAPGGVNYGDQQIFVDDDGSAYLSYTDWTRGGDLIVELLDPTFTTGSGQWSRVNIRSTEAPTIFKRGDVYYLTYSDPNRGYATTGTGYVTAASPLGPWVGSQQGDAWTVAGGALSIVGGDVGLSRDGDAWSDYTFRAVVTPQRAGAGDYAQVGLVFRSSAAGSYQWLIGNYPHAGATGGNLTKLIPGKPASVVALPVSIVTGQAYDIQITVQGSTIETRIDGQLVDTTVDTTLSQGRVGFRESGVDAEKVRVDSVEVTSTSGGALLSDDFTGTLAQWDRPASLVTGTNLTTTSCGGQPADVLPIATSTGTVYLYQSDVWMDGKANEALARHYWAPLEFDANGAILPITCEPSVDVTIPVTAAAPAPAPSAVTTGDLGFRVHADVGGGIARSQSFTVPKAGALTEVRFMTFQTGKPNAPLVLELRRQNADGTLGAVVGSTSVPANSISWAARWATLSLPAAIPVGAGDAFSLSVRSATTTAGRYGILYSDTTPYAGGSASISWDNGSTWTTEGTRALRLQADIVTAPSAPLDVAASAGTSGTSGAMVTWRAPDADGGSAVTGYRVYREGQATPVATAGAGATSALVAGLWPGDTARFTVTAVNAIGESVQSAASGFVTIPDGAAAKPARGALSNDNGWDTGLQDGSYLVTMNLWWGENGSLFRLYENGVLVSTKKLTYKGKGAQTAVTAITGRANGTYVYTGELVNSKGATATSSTTVVVTQASPGVPVLSHDNGDGNGSYTLTANLWWGTNATTYRFYEDGVVVKSGQLTARTPSAQTATLKVDGRSVGSHTYVVEFINDLGVTPSAPITVRVRK
jgi:hypothetical protein